MKKILSVMGSISLLILGGFIYFLIFSGFYSHLINPVFTWLSGSCGALLLIMGFVTLFRRFEVKLSAIIIMFVFIILCLISPSLKLHAESRKYSRENLNGAQYIPINIAEMFMILYNNPPKKVMEIINKNNYVFRGFIYRNNKLDKVSNIVALRVAMVRCFADTCAYGFRIQVDNVSQFKNDEWVKVYGHINKIKPDRLEQSVDIESAANTEVKEDYMFVADKIEPDRDPPSPFMTEFKEKEPFAY